MFKVLAVAVVPQALGLRPSATSSAMSAQFAQLRDFATAAPSSDPTASLKQVAGVVNSIMIQAGNATDHLTADDVLLLNQVIGVIRDSMYFSLTDFHDTDKGDLSDAIDAINQCHLTFAARIADGGDLSQMEDSVTTYQNTLNGLQDDVDTKTSLNDTAWNNLYTHMGLISDAPACTGLPNPRTMASLDVYFTSSAYVTWWNAQKLAYEPFSEAFKYADEQLELALTAYAVGLAVRDVAYCDWKKELEAACATFSTCYEDAKAFYLNVEKPRVELRMKQRIEAYKAGETIIHQIKFLLATEPDQATPAINTDIYQIAFPAVPAKPACDMSALDDAAWVPTPNCEPNMATSAVSDLDASETDSASIVDASGAHFNTPGTELEDGVKVWNLDGSPSSYMQASGTQWTVARSYTHCAWIKWRESNHGWRTIFRPTSDHSILVKHACTELGMYSNRNGGFRGTGYNIVKGSFQLVCVVGVGDSDTSSVGVSKFFVGSAAGAPTLVGQADRVASGTQVHHVGHPGQGPGKLARMTAWNEALTPEQLQAFWTQTKLAFQ